MSLIVLGALITAGVVQTYRVAKQSKDFEVHWDEAHRRSQRYFTNEEERLKAEIADLKAKL